MWRFRFCRRTLATPLSIKSDGGISTSHFQNGPKWLRVQVNMDFYSGHRQAKARVAGRNRAEDC